MSESFRPDRDGGDDGPIVAADHPVTTGMMLPVAERMDQAGFDAIELISSSHLKKCVRELKEDPWARVRLMSQRITRTPLRLNAGRFSAFDIRPRR